MGIDDWDADHRLMFSYRARYMSGLFTPAAAWGMFLQRSRPMERGLRIPGHFCFRSAGTIREVGVSSGSSWKQLKPEPASSGERQKHRPAIPMQVGSAGFGALHLLSAIRASL